MPHPLMDRSCLRLNPLSERENKVRIESAQVTPDTAPRPLNDQARNTVAETADRMRRARREGRPVIMAFGAHAIKAGLGPVLIRLLEERWLQHLATNGAGIIHDWELAYQGCTSEDVRANVREGRFGMWEETGFHLNLAFLLGARAGRGYGESIGHLIEAGAHDVPTREELLRDVAAAGRGGEAAERAAAAADILRAFDRGLLKPGRIVVAHPHKRFSVQAAAYRNGVPFTGHPMIGHDIIYVHPLNSGAAIGRTAERDFLCFANQVAGIEGGVYLSVGSAVMSPMIFEKTLSMAQNLARQSGPAITDHFMAVVDLAESHWDWSRGEPPSSAPDYYLRYCKTFSRMGGTMRYASADNRDFLLTLCRELGVH